MPIAPHKSKEHGRFVAFILYDIQNRQRGSRKIEFVINKIHKIERVSNQIGNEVVARSGKIDNRIKRPLAYNIAAVSKANP